ARIGHEGGSGEHLAAVLFDEQNLVEGELSTRVASCAVEDSHLARRHAHLPAPGLNDCVHVCHLCKIGSLHLNEPGCKVYQGHDLMHRPMISTGGRGCWPHLFGRAGAILLITAGSFGCGSLLIVTPTFIAFATNPA